jgi:hypothetical protein
LRQNDEAFARKPLVLLPRVKTTWLRNPCGEVCLKWAFGNFRAIWFVFFKSRKQAVDMKLEGDNDMKQRHIQSFLMVSAAFLAINVPTGARANSSSTRMSAVQQVLQTRVQSAQTNTVKRRESKREDDAV